MVDFDFKESFDVIKESLPKLQNDGYGQQGQTVYNEIFDRIEIYGKDGCWLGITNKGVIEADIAPFAG